MQATEEPLPDVLVVDASVLINLLSVSDRPLLFKRLPRLIVPEQVAAEVIRDPRTGQRAPTLLRSMADDDHLQIDSLSSNEAELFVELCGMPWPDGLDDGEAAALAMAVCRSTPVAVDDGKAIRIAGMRFSDLVAMTTVDIYLGLSRQGQLTAMFLAEAVFDSLRLGRMRVTAEREDWVLTMLGADRAVQCSSLRRRHR